VRSIESDSYARHVAASTPRPPSPRPG
jgi:hypothetical protein